MMTDPIADMLARIRNAAIAHHEKTKLPSSKLKQRVADILKAEGYIADYEVQTEAHPPVMTIHLKYGRGRIPAIAGLKKTSRPGRRVYVPHDSVPHVYNGMGIAILSTSQGVMSGREAKKRGIGGEVLCEVW
jgi:small subunit ribosomal protein S8